MKLFYLATLCFWLVSMGGCSDTTQAVTSAQARESATPVIAGTTTLTGADADYADFETAVAARLLALSRPDPHQFGEPLEPFAAGAVCEYGIPTQRYAHASHACLDAHDEALATGEVEAAVKYARIGCAERYAESCRQVARLRH